MPIKAIKVILFTMFSLFYFISSAQGQGILGFQEVAGCEKENDKLLPTLVICGRNPVSGSCPAYSNPCTLADFVETGRRSLIWIISIVLMILPVFISYYGALMIINRKSEVGGVKWAALKEKALWLIIYFVCLLGAWIIVRTIVDITQVRTDRINTFLIDEKGDRIEARQFDLNR